jgi:membrane carboxypeptidase/penicillin-binding protein
LTGAAAALPAWINYMSSAVRQPDLGFGPPPPGITMLSIDPASGGIATPACPRVQMMPFLEGTEPTRLCPLHSGFSSSTTTTADSGGAPGGSGDTEAADGGASSEPGAEKSSESGTESRTRAAANGVFGAVGNLIDSLFGHH